MKFPVGFEHCWRIVLLEGGFPSRQPDHIPFDNTQGEIVGVGEAGRGSSVGVSEGGAGTGVSVGGSDVFVGGKGVEGVDMDSGTAEDSDARLMASGSPQEIVAKKVINKMTDRFDSLWEREREVACLSGDCGLVRPIMMAPIAVMDSGAKRDCTGVSEQSPTIW